MDRSLANSTRQLPGHDVVALCGDPKNLIKAHDRAVVVAVIWQTHSQQDRAPRVEK